MKKSIPTGLGTRAQRAHRSASGQWRAIKTPVISAPSSSKSSRRASALAAFRRSSSIPPEIRQMEDEYRDRPTIKTPISATPPEILWLDWLATPIPRPAKLPKGLIKKRIGVIDNQKFWWRLRYLNPVTDQSRLTYIRRMTFPQAIRWRNARYLSPSTGYLVILEQWSPSRHAWYDENNMQVSGEITL